MDYELDEYRESKLVRMDILVNGDPVDAFSSIVHIDKAREKGKDLCEKLAAIIPLIFSKSQFKLLLEETWLLARMCEPCGKTLQRNAMGRYHS